MIDQDAQSTRNSLVSDVTLTDYMGRKMTTAAAIEKMRRLVREGKKKMTVHGAEPGDSDFEQQPPTAAQASIPRVKMRRPVKVGVGRERRLVAISESGHQPLNLFTLLRVLNLHRGTPLKKWVLGLCWILRLLNTHTTCLNGLSNPSRVLGMLSS